MEYWVNSVGFPIQKSTGQRVQAPHRGLSQPITSFIASYRQGIRQKLFLYFNYADLFCLQNKTYMALLSEFIFLLLSVSLFYLNLLNIFDLMKKIYT